MVLIDTKFNEEQLLPETFFPKMRIEWNICRKTNNFFPFYIYYNVIDNPLSTYSRCCQISYFMACNVGGYGFPHLFQNIKILFLYIGILFPRVV